ncbi:MAG: hypothetical protein ACRDSJ_06010 [Rubrobacteraceae bacterium]
MVKVSIEVRKGAARVSVAVCAESIERAVEIIEGRFPEGECRVKFPIDPEEFLAVAPAKHPNAIAA